MNRFTAIEETTYGGEDDGKVEFVVVDNCTGATQSGFATIQEAQAMARVKNEIAGHLASLCSK